MTPISRTLDAMAHIKLDQERKKAQRKSKKTTVIDYANAEYTSCKDLAIKHS